MNVLVAYATRHGSTKGIAERIAAVLDREGLHAAALPVRKVTDLEGYDAVLLGGSTYVFHWHKDAVQFAREHVAFLTEHPTWLFSSGPIGTDLVNKQGVDVLVASRPKEFDELVTLIRPVAEKVFFGAYDPTARPIGMSERLLRTMPAARDGLPAGDFRDWDAIESWAAGVAAELKGKAGTS